MAQPTTCTLVLLEGFCSDGVTRAAKLEVEGPNGAFTWLGGERDIRTLKAFLSTLRQIDYRIASNLTLISPEPVAGGTTTWTQEGAPTT